MDHDRRCKMTRPPFMDSQGLFSIVYHPQQSCGTPAVVALLGPRRRSYDRSGLRRMASEVLAWLIFFFVVFSGSPALACPSCVSDDPITLYSWEQWKVYTGFARTDEFKFMDSRGQETREITLDARNTTTISVGHTISARSFVTLTAPYIVNKKGKALGQTKTKSEPYGHLVCILSQSRCHSTPPSHTNSPKISPPS